jgi:predicted DNA-binding protein
MKHKVKQTAVIGMRLPPQIKQRVEAVAAKSDRSQSWVVKRCVALALSELEKQLPFHIPDPQQGGMRMAA